MPSKRGVPTPRSGSQPTDLPSGTCGRRGHKGAASAWARLLGEAELTAPPSDPGRSGRAWGSLSPACGPSGQVSGWGCHSCCGELVSDQPLKGGQAWRVPRAGAGALGAAAWAPQARASHGRERQARGAPEVAKEKKPSWLHQLLRVSNQTFHLHIVISKANKNGLYSFSRKSSREAT